MSGGGGSSGPSSTTTNTSNIPSYLEPYVTRNVAGAEAVAGQQYTPYGSTDTYGTGGNNRIAGFNQNQTQTQNQILGLQAPQQYDQATAATQGAMGSSWTDPGIAQSFMNPYQQGVTDIANQMAARNANIQGTQDNATFAKAGAFGGSRQGIVDAERERNLGMLQNQNQITGANTAYNTGMGQYNQQIQNQLAGGMNLANIGSQQQTANLNLLNAQQGVGAQQQALAQQGMTQNYQDFLNQQNWAKDQAGWMAGIIHGTPAPASTTLQEAAPPPNLTGQLTGLGIAGLGAYGASQAGAKTA